MSATRVVAAACDRSTPLGMISGEIKDWQLSTSSTYPSNWDRTCHERYARLYQPNGHAWCAKYKTSSEWLQIDLGVAAKACSFHRYDTIRYSVFTCTLKLTGGPA